MKLQNYAYSFLLLLAGYHALSSEIEADQWGPVIDHAQMSITIGNAKNEIKMGEPCRLLVRIRNMSTNEVLCFYNASLPNADITDGLACVVISPSGKDVSPKTDTTILGGSGGLANALPGRSIQFVFPLSQLCRLEEIGTYKITASKRTLAAAKVKKAVVLTSNTLCVSVIRDK